MAVLLIADVNEGRLATDAVAKTLAAVAGLGEVHVLVMNLLMLTILGHAGMAIFHHYVLKDGLLKKMIPLS